jgi:galactokinase
MMGEMAAEWAGRYGDVGLFVDQVGQLAASGFFEQGRDVHMNRTPGRLDLMGGNDDYTGGLVFEATIREATLVAAQARTDRLVSFYNPDVQRLGWAESVEIDLAEISDGGSVKPVEAVRSWINADPRRSWCSYIVGNLYFLLEHFADKVTHGLSLYVRSDVPLGKGVSSSAALEVAAMKAMAAAYGLHAGGVELASWTQWAEIALTQSACGIMDQYAVVAGDEGHLTPMVCQPCQPRPLVKTPEVLKLWGVDSGVQHSVAGIEYERARAATFMGYRLLCNWENLQPTLDETGALARWVDSKWFGYLANLSPSEFRQCFEARLPETLDGADFEKTYGTHLDPYTPVRPGEVYPVRAATRYAVEENSRVAAFSGLVSRLEDHIDEDAVQVLGELMLQSHIGYSECGLGSHATDRLVELARAERGNGLIGAKITGGGAGGTVAILARNTPSADSALERVVERYGAWRGEDPYVFRGSSIGSDRFGVQRLRW